MCCIYNEDVDITLAFNSVTKIIMVIKQLENSRQLPLLTIVRRLIGVISKGLDTESISKLLALIASIKTSNSKEILRISVDGLLQKLKTQQAYSESSQD